MIILGKTACGDSDSMMATATNVEDINMIQLSSGVICFAGIFREG